MQVLKYGQYSMLNKYRERIDPENVLLDTNLYRRQILGEILGLNRKNPVRACIGLNKFMRSYTYIFPYFGMKKGPRIELSDSLIAINYLTYGPHDHN